MSEEILENVLNDSHNEINTEEIENDLTDHEKSEVVTEETSKEKHKLLRLPLARIKGIMKLDPDCTIISQDSLFLIAKATELFVEYLVKESSKNLIHGKRKTVMRRDVDAAVESIANLCFLDGVFE